MNPGTNGMGKCHFADLQWLSFYEGCHVLEMETGRAVCVNGWFFHANIYGS